MSKIISVKKSETKSVYLLTKNNKFYAKMSKVLLRLGLEEWDFPIGFPEGLSEGEESIDLENSFDFFDEIEGKTYNLMLIYGKDKIFLIFTADINKSNDFNIIFNKVFSF